jgi:hypothetical protein
MKRRCNSASATGFENYGGRGIRVCCEWEKDYINFYKWAIESGYSP